MGYLVQKGDYAIFSFGLQSSRRKQIDGVERLVVELRAERDVSVVEIEWGVCV
jgi:hypothetical protein